MPELKEKLLLNHAGTDLLIRGTQEVRDIVDWPVGERDGYEFGEVNLVPNCYHYGALLAMYELSREEWYLRRAAEVKQAIRAPRIPRFTAQCSRSVSALRTPRNIRRWFP